MIIFNRLWKYLNTHELSVYELRKRTGLDNKTITRLTLNENTETRTLNRICAGLQCKLEDIAEYVEDPIE